MAGYRNLRKQQYTDQQLADGLAQCAGQFHASNSRPNRPAPRSMAVRVVLIRACACECVATAPIDPLDIKRLQDLRDQRLGRRVDAEQVDPWGVQRVRAKPARFLKSCDAFARQDNGEYRDQSGTPREERVDRQKCAEAWRRQRDENQHGRAGADCVASRFGQNRFMKNRLGILRQIPTGIWVLGLVSMLMDISSEMIHSLLPLFMVTVLGATASTVGLIEGLAESTALIVKVFSGTLSDWLGRRKELAVFGYALGALSKPLFAIASTMGIVLGARLIDRVGKGIRGAPRDALVADIAPAQLRGAAFGLRQSLDTVGAFLGPLLAVCLMLLWANDFRRVFWIAVIPGVLAVALLFFALREPPRNGLGARVNPLRREHLRRLGPKYWWVVGIGTVFTLARFSEAFLVLRSQRAGVPIALVPLVMVAMNLVYAASAYPFGKLSDRMSHARLLVLGIVVLIAADLVLAIDGHWSVVLIGVVLWGVHMGMTQGLLAAMVAETSPADLRGTAYGFFNLASGVAMLAASGVAGIIWDAFGPPATFLAGAFFCFLALSVLALRRFRTKS
jgi:MFS family permease